MKSLLLFTLIFSQTGFALATPELEDPAIALASTKYSEVSLALDIELGRAGAGVKAELDRAYSTLPADAKYGQVLEHVSMSCPAVVLTVCMCFIGSPVIAIGALATSVKIKQMFGSNCRERQSQLLQDVREHAAL